MEPLSTAVAVETADESPNREMVSDNIARFIKEHEVSATRRNMHIHHEDDDAESPDGE